MSPIKYQFNIDTHQNIYVAAIENEEPSLVSTDYQLPCKKTRYILLCNVHL